ncbi:DNA replication and repair protein RadA [Magnetococcus marinus MC-1]|uniref:DNA repair protein RadA n=1 Tax=Magnetococcus marinus (strain ATCC BAA-1437 / JCM 17883 / MC-1) TaxID=156889 RepID=A0L497_MAGMM|nr:DNA repair protein RadA [Magnetococcus marinus]ABK42790.1 DNA replication and repair protein RadA [Magnetococcus marinus MC-1]
MAKAKEQFVCTECGAEYSQWQGKCHTCQAWNSLKAFTPAKKGARAAHPTLGVAMEPITLDSVAGGEAPRIQIGISELDRVLGGGLVSGAAILIGGDPGIGKSTLLMGALAKLSTSLRVLYVSGEESLIQLKLRAERMGVDGANFWVFMENRLEAVEEAVNKQQPDVLVVDSIQTIAGDEIPSAAGTVTQVRECASRMIQWAKRRNMALFLIGHVTKEGQIAGPRILEHMVDTVLYFEGERGHSYRILRAVKNRFGAANEIGVFEMRENGLAQVTNPSELFLAERVGGAAGSVVYAGLEGTRPVLIEIQSLVTPSPLPQPRRNTVGIDTNRLAMLIAVLEKRLGLGLFNHDIFLNVAGGFRINEPSADLAVTLSLYAALRNISLDPGMVVLGEVGLAGEVRAVSHATTRLKEAQKLGFTRCILPKKSMKGVPDGLGITLHPVALIEDAIALLA